MLQPNRRISQDTQWAGLSTTFYTGLAYSILYLLAIVAANLLVTTFGPGVIIFNAFVFIGLDLTCRDALHDSWHRRGLWWKMTVLILAGSLLSWWLNRDAAQIAIASFVAFAAASSTDAFLYHLLRRRRWFVRSNGSNMIGAAVDSVIFPTLAFGALMPWIILGQFAAKVCGGLMWSFVIIAWNRRAREDELRAELTRVQTIYLQYYDRIVELEGQLAEARKWVPSHTYQSGGVTFPLSQAMVQDAIEDTVWDETLSDDTEATDGQ